MHAYTHTYIHTYIHTYVHTYTTLHLGVAVPQDLELEGHREAAHEADVLRACATSEKVSLLPKLGWYFARLC